MYRFTIKTTILGLVAIAAANAGEIQVGGAAGLTNSYVNSGVGSAGTFNEQNYDTNLFFGAQESSVAPTPYVGYNQTCTPSCSGGTITDNVNNITFSMIDDGTASTSSSNYGQASNVGQSNNLWVSTSTGADTITVPVGIFGVEQVWTMLNTELGGAGSMRDVDIIMNFGSSATDTSSDVTRVEFLPTNTDTYTTSGNHFAIMNGTDCTGGTGCTGTGYGSTGGNNGPSNPVSNTTPTYLANPNSYGALGSTTYYTQNLFNTNNLYNSAVGSEANTSGYLSLEDVGYYFSGNLATLAGSSYLVSVQIQEASAMQTGASAVGLSAITVVTPEPSTVLLLLSGLGAVGFGRFRRRK